MSIESRFLDCVYIREFYNENNIKQKYRCTYKNGEIVKKVIYNKDIKNFDKINKEIEQLEKELIEHNKIQEQGWMKRDIYKKWLKKRNSLFGKIIRREIKTGMYLTDDEFKVLYSELRKKDYYGTTLSEIKREDLSPRQSNLLMKLMRSQAREHGCMY